ncbi:MAG: response regulator transcription factor [Deferribacterales bacterium]
MQTKLMIIDDDLKLIKMLNKYLSEYSFIIDSFDNPETALEKFQECSPNLVILDIMMPKINGFELCKRIRKFSNVPIIMLSARREVEDRIVGLEIGADDYLPKPFEPRELVARIQAVIKRREPMPAGERKTPQYSFGRLIVEPSKYTATLDGVRLDLTTSEFGVLYLFVRNPFVTLDRDKILNELKGIDCDAFNRTVDVTVSRLRNKLKDDPKEPQYIKTVWGTGYMFIGTNNHD